MTRAAALAVLLLLTGCGGSGDGPDVEPQVRSPDTLKLTSTAFADGEAVPEHYTCDGANTPPPLAWDPREAPRSVRAWALLVDDPDAPSGLFTHWVVLDIPVDQVAIDGAAPVGSVEGKNSRGEVGYTGPCPPSGTHHYRFTVFGLSDTADQEPGVSVERARDAISRLAVADGVLVGTYER